MQTELSPKQRSTLDSFCRKKERKGKKIEAEPEHVKGRVGEPGHLFTVPRSFSTVTGVDPPDESRPKCR